MRIGLLDLCRPFDSQPEQLAAALKRKLCTYGPLLEALLSYAEHGWQVKILPWVVGVRGMIDEKSVSEILNFLRVPRDRCARIIEDVAIKSVKALYSLHQIRYQALRLNMHKAGTRTGKTTTGGGRRLRRDAATLEEDGERDGETQLEEDRGLKEWRRVYDNQ